MISKMTEGEESMRINSKWLGESIGIVNSKGVEDFGNSILSPLAASFSMEEKPDTQQKASEPERDVKYFKYKCFAFEDKDNGAHGGGLHMVPKKGWIQHDFRIQGLSEMRDSIRLQLRLSHHGLRLSTLTLFFKGEATGMDLMNELDFETEILPQLRNEDKESFFSFVIEVGAPVFAQWPLPGYIVDLFWLELPLHLLQQEQLESQHHQNHHHHHQNHRIHPHHRNQPRQHRQQCQQNHQPRFSQRGTTQDIRVDENGYFDSYY